MNKFLKPLSLLLILFLSGKLYSQEIRKYTTTKIQGESPKIDGILDDQAWNQINWEDSFTQFKPLNGGKASQKTAFKILYDQNFLYVAIRAYDSVPSEIIKRMSRRDGFQGDWVEIAFDSYHDYSTAYSFTASVSGVKNDELYTNDGFGHDRTWDPIWHLKTSIDQEGWVAEMKIPFTQLRFSAEQNQVWGLEVKRYLNRKDERSLWQAISNTQAGYVSRFGELHGLKNIKPEKQFDLIPYALGSYNHFEVDQENPFTNGKEKLGRVGLDAKIGLTNNLTLDLTINPDFGQVEADPSEVNLTAFETYLQEKRMFFIEGRNIYSFPLRLGGGGGGDNLFYSRRIGKRPSYSPDSYAYKNAPDNTSILGAAKITGKTKNGLSIGILESVTGLEKAQYSDSEGQINDYTAEPLSNYFVGRLEKEYDDGNTKIGGMFTATNRQIKDDYLDILPRSAYTGGINFDHSWNNRKYNFSVKLMGSSVQGSTEAISELQTASSRYFQRPDASHMEYTPNLTQLVGHAGSIWAGKFSSGGLSYIAWFSWQSPGFELNDLGYMRKADEITQMLWGQYNFLKPFSIFRKFSIEGSQSSNYDFSGRYLGNNADLNFSGQFTNYWGFRFGGSFNSNQLDKTLLRGGPLFKTPHGLSAFGRWRSDRRKKLSASAGISYFFGADNFRFRQNYSLGLSYHPADNIKISLNPSLRLNKNQLQYIDGQNINSQDYYFLAEINQKTFVTQFRVDYSLSPDFSIQFYAQPFVSTGEYSHFKMVTNPVANSYQNRFVPLNLDDDFSIITDNSNIPNGSLYNPNFKFLQYQSNLVARWEYRPGSILYLVWSQSKTDYPDTYAFDFNTDMDDLFSIFPHNVFLIKLSYRLPI